MSDLKSRVVVSRKWHNPEITVSYDSNGVYIYTSAEDFVIGMLYEYESMRLPWWKRLVNWHYPSAEQMHDLIMVALRKAEDEMKQVTIHFPPPSSAE